MGIWSREHNNLWNFPNLVPSEQQRILDLFKKKDIVQENWLDMMISRILRYIPKSDIVDIAFNIATHADSKVRDIRGTMHQLMYDAYKEDPILIKDAVKTSKNKHIQKMILTMSPDLEEESAGLRALVGNKTAPEILKTLKYKPRVKAIKSLPPVMRLNLLETLTNSKLVAYNVFENFSRGEFEDMLFPNIIRHQQRVSDMLERFTEIECKGKDSVVTIKAECKNCGPYELEIRNQVFRTQSGLMNTHLGNMLMGTWCSFCHAGLRQKPSFEAQDGKITN